MLQLSTQISEQRADRRIAVRLPLTVSGRDSRGVTFQEETSSENLCRSGAAFVTRFDLPVGCDVEIHIPIAQSSARRKDMESDFATCGRSCGKRRNARRENYWCAVYRAAVSAHVSLRVGGLARRFHSTFSFHSYFPP
jgi:hypothetical protein